MNAMLPAHLSETINNLGDAARALADEVRADRAQRDAELAEERTQRRRDARRMTIGLVIIGILVAGLVALAVSNRVLNSQNRSIVQTIESCTTADGECAKEGQARTEAAIGKLLRMDIEVAACARARSDDREFRACVDRALAQLVEAPPAGTPPTPAPPAPRPSPAPSVTG